MSCLPPYFLPLRCRWTQGKLNIFTQVREKLNGQLNGRKCCSCIELVNGNVIQLGYAICTATNILKNKENMRSVRAEHRTAIAANAIHRVDLALGCCGHVIKV